MRHTSTHNPSTASTRATAHRAIALAALRANSSLSVHLHRYNDHMAKARALEVESLSSLPTKLIDAGNGIAIARNRRSIKRED